MLSDAKNRQMLLVVSYYVAVVGGFGGALIAAWGVASFLNAQPFDGLVGVVGGGLLIVLCLLIHLLARCLAAVLSICIELLETLDNRRRDGG